MYLRNLKKHYSLHNITPFSPIVLLIPLLVVSVFFYKLAFGWYPAKYTESAHVRVNRSTISSIGHAVGNCVHCHEQHASIEGDSHTPYDFALFAPNNPDSQTANFCFQCHKGVGSVQVGGITNYTYSKNFGGGTATFTTIYDAFNPTTGATPSSHQLSDIQNYVTGKVGMTSDTNPCVVCHNPHTAQDNHPVSLSGMGGVNTAIRRITHYENLNTNLWGDEDNATSGYAERMKDLTNNYQAPYYVGKITYEPANNATADGSNLPNFARFCYACHKYSNVYSTERSGNLTQIDWSTTGDMHGKHHDDSSGWGSTKAPYGSETTNYVMACTDCHEPHGSTNEWLLRTCVNGKDNISITSSGWWWDFCTACHNIGGGSWHQSGNRQCSDCHTHSWNEGFF